MAESRAQISIGFDFNAVTLQRWKRLQAYTDLRNNLPRTDTSAHRPVQVGDQARDAANLSDKIAAATTWKQENIDKLIAT